MSGPTGRWAKISVDFFDHPKVANLSPADRDRFLQLVTYCAKFLTDGEITRDQIGTRWGQKWSRCVPLLDRLLTAGLVDYGSADDRYVIHDFCEWQETREQAESRRQANRERQQVFRERKKTTRKSPRVTPLSNGDRNAVSNAAREEKSKSLSYGERDLRVSSEPEPSPLAQSQTKREVPLVDLMERTDNPMLRAVLDKVKAREIA